MAADQVGISQKDAEAFSVKLDAWAQNLDAKERALLHVLLKSAGAAIPSTSELSDAELGKVAGGVGIQTPQIGNLALGVFSGFLGKGGLAAGGEVKEGGNPTTGKNIGQNILNQ